MYNIEIKGNHPSLPFRPCRSSKEEMGGNLGAVKAVEAVENSNAWETPETPHDVDT